MKNNIDKILEVLWRDRVVEMQSDTCMLTVDHRDYNNDGKRTFMFTVNAEAVDSCSKHNTVRRKIQKYIDDGFKLIDIADVDITVIEN